MKKSVKKEWLKALRSGEYEQRKGWLCRDGAFCCLGVLVDACVDTWWKRAGDRGTWGISDENTLPYFNDLPRQVLKDVELPWSTEGKLIGMNDDGATFHEIADWIEVNL